MTIVVVTMVMTLFVSSFVLIVAIVLVRFFGLILTAHQYLNYSFLHWHGQFHAIPMSRSSNCDGFFHWLSTSHRFDGRFDLSSNYFCQWPRPLFTILPTQPTQGNATSTNYGQSIAMLNSNTVYQYSGSIAPRFLPLFHILLIYPF